MRVLERAVLWLFPGEVSLLSTAPFPEPGGTSALVHVGLYIDVGSSARVFSG